MSKSYSYGPFKGDFFTNYEKIWIEGFFKEQKKETDANNLKESLTVISVNAPKAISDKCIKLLESSSLFESYVKNNLSKTWDKILVYAMSKVSPRKMELNEEQIVVLKKSTGFLLKEEKRLIIDKVSSAYGNEIIKECLESNDNYLDWIKDFNPMVRSTIVDSVKNNSPILEHTAKHLDCMFDKKGVLENEPFMRMMPDAESVLGIISWTVESVKILESLKNK